MTSDPDEWAKKPILNPFTELTPWELGDVLKTAVLAIYEFWSSYDQNPNPIRASVSPGRNDPCPCGSGKKYKRCCGRSAWATCSTTGAPWGCPLHLITMRSTS